jgi:hypothetical protein
MTDIYRQELDIPDKPKPFGWFLLALGGVMLLFAVFFFFQELREGERYNLLRPVVKTTSAPAITPISAEKAKLARAKAGKLFWIVVLALVLVMAFILAVTVSHRIAQHLRAQSDKKISKTTYSDPWKEAGERMKTPPSEE